MRASAAASLNDLGEVRHGWELIADVLATMPASSSVDLLQGFAADPTQTETQHEVFVLSASTVGDDAAQWRLYGDGGRGYVLELDASVPLAAVSKVPAAVSPSATRRLAWLVKDVAAVSPWRHVLYSRTKVELAIDELVTAMDAEEQRLTSIDGIPEDVLAEEHQTFQGDAFDAVATIAHLIKSPGFSGEQEVRVVTTFMLGEEHIQYRPGSNGIVAYATLAQAPPGKTGVRVMRPKDKDTPLETRLPVVSVRLGPLLQPAHEKTMTAYLRSWDLRHVRIEASEVPLR